MRNKIVLVLCEIALATASVGLGVATSNMVHNVVDKTITVEFAMPKTTYAEEETSSTTMDTSTIPATTTTSETTVTTRTSTTTVAATTKKATTKGSTTRATTTTARATTVTSTTTEIDIPETTTVVSTETETVVAAPSEEFIGTFTRGTYYTFGSRGGSGRPLVSGYSIASRALYEKYGYGDYKIRIECDEFPALNGVYSLDDCSAKGDNRVIDFWFAPGDVPGYFYQQGVLEVRAYLVK